MQLLKQQNKPLLLYGTRLPSSVKLKIQENFAREQCHYFPKQSTSILANRRVTNHPKKIDSSKET
jgi:hypothetical protein